MKRPTIIDVAKAAAVSKSTVSLVLQNSPLVRPATRVLVEQAMAALGYVYNRAAANLRQSNTGLIGLVINDLRNPFFTEFATSAQMEFSRQGFATVIANTAEDPALQAQVVGSMIEHGVAALVISPTYGDEWSFDALLRAGVPALQVLRQVDRRAAFPFASFDYVEGGRLATRHLLAGGARRVAFVGGLEGRPITQERMAGYLEVMAAAGLPPHVIPATPSPQAMHATSSPQAMHATSSPQAMHATPSPQAMHATPSPQAMHATSSPQAMHATSSRAFGRDLALTLCRDGTGLDAALCFNDLVALGMQAGFAQAGHRVGRDFRLVGFDDIEEAALGWPKLSSVRCNVAEFGRNTAAAMLGWLVGGIVPPAVSRAEVALMVRGSSEPAVG